MVPFFTHTRFTWAKDCAITGSPGTRDDETSVNTDFFLPEYANSFANNGFDGQCDS
ncbi:hypothetical protein [Archangium primigenium]|uniref:hypothetical protein n=1 Tax=[Archangium] primigenium TaxID=2792470 RepID=UPI001958A674|nr:hypothetical protein [Archangium primigenium]MBM7116145.1 hypothetical protein [Archangium primigenium]